MFPYEKVKKIRHKKSMQSARENAVLMRQQMFHLSQTLTQAKQHKDTGEKRAAAEQRRRGRCERREEAEMRRHQDTGGA